MHPVADKIKLTAFEGEVDVLGKPRCVAFFGENDHEKATLTIQGLSVAEAYDALSRLHGPGAALGVTADIAQAVKEKAAKVEVVKEKKPDPKPIEAKAVEVKKEPAKEPRPAILGPAPEADDDDLDGGGKEDGIGAAFDMELLGKADKLRTVIQHIIEKGFKKEAQIIEQCVALKAKVPALQTVDAKGDFENRIQRAAAIVLSEATA